MRHRWLLAFCIAGALAGCGKGPSLKTYPVKGTVTYNGKPVGGATVAYMGKSVEALRSTGITDPEGHFSIFTYVAANEVLAGVPAGEYQVTIVKQSTPSSGSGPSGPSFDSMSSQEWHQSMTKMWEQQRAAQGGVRPKEEKPKSEIPAKYGRPETSGFVAAVLAKENEPREFELVDD